MFILKFSSLILIHLLLLPLKIFTSLILRFATWFPYYTFDSNMFNKQRFDGAIDISTKYEKTESCLNKTKKDILKDGDGCKYLGLLMHTHYNAELWNDILKFQNNNTFLRYPNDIIVDNPNNFSGDMFVGIMSAYITKYIKVTLSPSEIARFKKIVDNIIFKNTIFQIRHPHNKESDRGFLLRWYELMPGFSHSILLTKFMHILTKEKKYKILYNILMTISWPISFLSSYGVCIGKYDAVNWYSEHTYAWNYYLGSLLGISRFNRLLKQQTKNFKYNPEIIALNCIVNGCGSGDLHFIKMFLEEYTDIEQKLDSNKLITIRDLKHKFQRSYRSKNILPSRYRVDNKYMWEKDPLKPDSGRRRWCIDFMSLYGLYMKIKKE